MDNIRGEVSNKIRSAIKAKLMELGAYVDDELPDYIMVMVANKRSRKQMEDDLLLFLGDSTATFTAWLHTVLSKLQQVTVNTTDLKKGSERKRSSSEDHKKEKRKKIKKEKGTFDNDKSEEEELDVNASPTTQHPVKMEDDSSRVEEGTTSLKRQTSAHVPVVSGKSSLNQEKQKGVGTRVIEDEDEEDFINLKADVETDMWGESEEIPPAAVKISDTNSRQPTSDARLKDDVPKPDDKQPLDASKSAIGNFQSNSLTAHTHKSSVEERRSTSRIIRISETIRQEQETLKPSSKIARDPQALARRVFQSHIVSQQNVKSNPGRSRRRSSSTHRSGKLAHRSDTRKSRRYEHEDLRETLRKERRKEREKSRDRERDRRRSRGENKSSKSHSAMGSVVQAPLSHKDDNEADQTLPSVLRVNPRPKVPAALQANKSLILKAVAEAQKSVSRAFVRSEMGIKNTLRPLIQKKSVKDRIQLQKQPGDQFYTTAKTENEEKKQALGLPPRDALKKMSFTVVSKNMAPSRDSLGAEFGDASEEGSIILDPSLNILIQVPAAPGVEELKKSPDPTQTEKVRRWIKDVEEATKLEVVPPNPNLDQEDDVEMDEDSFVALETASKVESNEGPEDFDEVLDADSNSLKVSDIHSVVSGDQLQRLNNGPQFVVTLDGLDPVLLQTFSMEEGKSDDITKEQSPDSVEVVIQDEKQEELVKEQLLRQELLRQQAIVRERKAIGSSAVTVPLTSVPVKRPVSPSCSLETRPVQVITNKPSNPERCKFWPVCKNGDTCEFHHPTVPCKLFPNCIYADRCLYTHPNCRFNAACTRGDCPYFHPGGKPINSSPPIGKNLLAGPSIKQACRFFPNCSNPSCPYLHPTVCKYGTHCVKPKCQFIHSDKGLNTKHKWVRH